MSWSMLLVAPVVAVAPTAPTPIEEWLASADVAIRRAAVAEVLARPEAVDPFNYALLTRVLWDDGRRLQATFWFYVFQARTRAWADADGQGGGAAALRGALNATLGPTINGWIGSDLVAWRVVASRALDYEARLPLGTFRPDGIAAADWAARVQNSRRAFRAGYEQTVGSASADEVAAQRRANSLPVGPLDAPGPPLPEAWR